ncbi:MAG TPA: TonB C-terminal domain-containing protein [Acidobacteriota bacterium]|nr:TonB C-terminal domain-containing protein [Acidobacteriota bacterium]
MSRGNSQITLLRIHLPEERYGRYFFYSIGIHGLMALLFIVGQMFIPQTTIILGSGPGGGAGGDISTVGIVDELSGGAGMVKPSIVPRPPALTTEPAPIDESKAIPIPETVTPVKKQPAAKPAVKPAAKPAPQAAKADTTSNVIPTAPQPGSGGIAHGGSGSGGGIGGGSGISIGTGSGGFGDSWYVRSVEARISSNWMRPPQGIRVEAIYSFFIAANGRIYNIKQEKSSGNIHIDQAIQRAITVSNPVPAPPIEFQGKQLQFIAHFVHPPLN